MKRTIITIVVLVVAAGGAAFILKGNKEKMQATTELAKKVNSSIPVQVADVKQESLTGTFTATGNFQPSKELTLLSEASGRVVSILVKEGQFVKEGQLLARLDHQVFEAEVKSAEASFQKISTDKSRNENLLKTGGISQAQLDEINLNYVTAETRLVNARKNLANTSIKAPFSGYVNKKYIEIGTYLSQQSNKTFDIVDLSKLKMVVNVTEAQVLSVNASRKISVAADVYPGTDYAAHVNYIGAKADANLNFPVELEITNIANKPLRGGMYGRATFELPGQASSLVIPRTALIGSVNDAQVYTIEDGRAKLKNITVGRQFSNTVEVLQGLSAGEKVVTTGQINLSEGAVVSVLQ